MRYFCIVSYDGYSFNGYQIQKHDSNTIQETIQNVLKAIFKEDIIIYGSGRTDKGVHAIAQTFHFDSLRIIPIDNLKKIMNQQLPFSIRIKKIKKVDDNFHARYNSHQKIYEYKIKNKENDNVFDNRYFTYIKEKLDVDLLKESASLFVGTHNFKNFTTNKESEVKDFIKTIYNVDVKKSKENIKISFYGSGFLRYQVRMMVGAMLVVAMKKKDISYIENMLKENVNNRCSYKAEPQGLYLKKVIY